MLRVWGRNNSINVQKVMWAVGELGLPHERIDVGGAFGGLDTAEYGALNPNRRIPTVEDDGRGGLGIQRLRALPGGALRRRPAVAGGRAAARAGRHVDGLAGLDPVARHDRGILGPDPHARGRARPRGDRGGGQAPRRDLADPRPAPGHPPLRRRRHAHDRRHPGRRQLLSLLRAADRAAGAAQRRALVRAPKRRKPFHEHVMVPIT